MENRWILSALLIGLLVGVAAGENQCKYEVVESMPDLMKFQSNVSFRQTHESLIELVDAAKTSIRLASFYVTFTAEPEYHNHPSTLPGKNLLDSITRAVQRGVNLQVILDGSSQRAMSNLDDVRHLQSLGDVKFVNMTKIVKSGVMHSKFLITDEENFYVGSSNFDWRSYTQIKEIGITFTDCRVLAKDLDKIFKTYQFFSDKSEVPSHLPDEFETEINIEHPLKLKMEALDADVFLAAAPPAFNGVESSTGRTDDIDSIVDIIDNARHRIDISVMNYGARTQFSWPKKFWPRIDDALRRAATERRVKVRMLVSKWSHVKEEEMMWYKSLNAIQSNALKGGGIHVKMFTVPQFDDFQKSIQFARVKHDKYMVTDNALNIGTSNWAPDYFITTCGVSVVIKPQEKSLSEGQENIIKKMHELFERDFNSEFANDLSEFSINV